MGWTRGSGLMSDVIRTIKSEVKKKETRTHIYYELIQHFEDYDCDNLMECVDEDPAFDEALQELHPGWFEDEE